MTTRLLQFFIGAALLLAATGVALFHLQPASSLGYSLRQWGLAGGQLGGLLLLVQTGSILDTRYFTSIAIGIALALLGAFFTILHRPGGWLMLPVGLLGILITYTIRFT